MQVERPTYLNLQIARHKDEQIIQEPSPERRPPLESGGVGNGVVIGDCDLLKPGTYQPYFHRQQPQSPPPQSPPPQPPPPEQQQTVCANQLCPNLQPSSPLPCVSPVNKQFNASLVGDKYLMLEILEGSTLHRCVNVHTQEEYVCKKSNSHPEIGLPMVYHSFNDKLKSTEEERRQFKKDKILFYCTIL